MAGASGSPGGRIAAYEQEIRAALAEVEQELPAPVFRSLVTQFASDAEAFVSAMAEAAGRGDTDELGRSAHKLAGLFGQLGLASLAGMARDASRDTGAAPLAASRELLPLCTDAVAAIRSVAAAS